MSKSSELVRIIIINLVLCLIILALAETGLRVFYKSKFLTDGNQFVFFEFDETLGWKCKPNINGQFKRGEEFDTTISTNSLGMRDKEYSLVKPTGKYRLAVLGDSFTWGFGVQNEDNYTEVLEKELGKDFEVLNFGVSGFGRGQQLLYMKNEVLPFKPDAVLIMAYPGNDLSDNMADDYTATIYPKPSFSVNEDKSLNIEGIPVKKPSGKFEERMFMRHTGKWMGLYSRSYLFRVFYHAFNTVHKSWEKDPSEYVNGIYQVKNLKTLKKQAEVEQAIMKEIKRVLDKKGIKLLVTMATTTEMVRPELQKMLHKHAGETEIDWQQPARLLTNASQSLGIPVINLQPALYKSEAAGKPVHNKLEFHWSKFGNHLVGKELVPYVRKLKTETLAIEGSETKNETIQ